MHTTTDNPAFSIIVPIYQATNSVAELVTRTTTLFDDKMKESFEIILIDDGSTHPETWPLLTTLAQADSRVRAIRLMRNYGKPAAVLCGFSHARGDWIVTIDDDLQQSPEDIAALAELRDHDVVVASYRDKKYSGTVKLTSRIKALFDIHLLRLPMPMSPLKLIRRRIVDEIVKTRSGRPHIPAMLAHITRDFKAVPCQRHQSKVNKSRYDFYRRLRQFSNLIIGSSGFLARIWAMIGMACFLCGGAFGLLMALLVSAAPTHIIAGLLWASMMIIGGMILMALGVIGEYLIRIVELTSHRAPFIVRQMVGSEDELEQVPK